MYVTLCLFCALAAIFLSGCPVSHRQTAKHTVTFVPDNGTAIAQQTITAGEKAIKPTAPTKGLQKFGGWFTATTYTKPWNFISDTVTLYALWVEDIFTVSENGGISVKDNTDATGHIFIPAELDGTAITEIAPNAFYQKTLTAVTIPFGVIKIDTNAFQECRGLALISLPSSHTDIAANAFINCALPEITIPANVTTLGENAFAHNASLKTVTVLSKYPPTIKGTTFDGSNTLLEIYVPKGCEGNYTNASGTSKGWGNYEAKIKELS